MKRILIGGSPCTHWSIAQKNNRETEPQGEGWELFKNYLIAKEKFKPDFFLYENNKSAAQPIKDQISRELEVPLQYINSALVSAQNRQRFYAHNIPNVPQPEDRGILLKDILECGVVDREKSYCLKHQAGNARDYFKKHHTQIAFEPLCITPDGKAQTLKAQYAIPVEFVDGVPKKAVSCADGKEYAVYQVSNGLITTKDKEYPIKLADGFYIIRKLTVTECCRLQTMPDDYCRAVSATQGYKGLGNGWTAEVIIHILKHMNIPLDEEIIVLSMYDGIGTGRYCFDKMGYKNIKYYAYEIDKYPIQVAMSNYDDIIQRGDAFDVRDENWSFGKEC